MQWLKVIGGKTRGKKYLLRDGTYSVGRDPSNQIELPSSSVSRLHSTLKVSGKSVLLEDKGSANGTIVNGRPIDKTRLKNGDKIYIGKFVLEYSLEDADDDVYDADTSAKAKASDLVLKKNLEKMAKISGRLSWSAKTLAVLAVTSITGAFFLIYSVNSKIRGDHTAIALSKGAELVKFLAEKNKLDLVGGNEMLLDVKSVLKEKGVYDAAIIDAKGLILAPINRQNQAEKNKYALMAVNSEESNVITSHEYDGNLYVLAYPVRSYDNEKGRYRTIGAAKIVFSPDKLIESLPSGGRISYLFAVIIIGAALIAYILIKKSTLSPLKSILDKTEQAKIEGHFEPGSYPAEFGDLAESIQRLASNLAVLKASEDRSQSASFPVDSPAALSNDRIDCILSVIPEPAIVFDASMSIVSLNEQAVFFFNLQGGSPLGKKISNVVTEKSYAETIEDLIAEASRGRSKITNKTLDVGLKTYEFSLTGVRDFEGKIEFGILLIETI